MTIYPISDLPVPEASSAAICPSLISGKHRSSQTRRTVPWLFPILILTVLLAAGCATKAPVSSPSFNQPVSFINPPKSIAILPFVNKTPNTEIADILRIVFYCHLSAHPFKDVELHVVDERLRTLGHENAEQLQSVPPQELGQLLGTDAVILGEVTKYERLFLGVYSQFSMGASISVVDTRSGRVIWKDKYTARIHEGGLPLTIFEIPFVSIRSGMNLSDSVKIRAADELSRNLAIRIPAPYIPNYSNKMAATCPVPLSEYILRPKGDVSTKESLIIK